VTIQLRPGPASYLHPDEEAALEAYLLKMAESGLPASMQFVQGKALQIMHARGEKIASITRNWFRRFMDRHPALSLKACIDIMGYIANFDTIYRGLKLLISREQVQAMNISLETFMTFLRRP